MAAEVRTLSTPAAQDAVKQMQSVLAGSFDRDLSTLGRQGQRLSDPNVWDGRNAELFRGDIWPKTDTALKALRAELAELQRKIDAITANIMTAG